MKKSIHRILKKVNAGEVVEEAIALPDSVTSSSDSNQTSVADDAKAEAQKLLSDLNEEDEIKEVYTVKIDNLEVDLNLEKAMKKTEERKKKNSKKRFDRK